MELAVDTLPFGIDQLEGVGAVAIHVAEAVRQPSIAEQERHLQTNRFVANFDILLITMVYKNLQDKTNSHFVGS